MAKAETDNGAIVHKAMLLFWQKGYHATSMRDLQAALDMRPGSIYARFGSKEGLFRAALRCYATENQSHLDLCLASAATPRAGLQSYISDLVIGGRKNAPSCLCFLVKTVSELTDGEAELLAEARHLLEGFQDRFAQIIRHAAGPRRARPDQFARQLMVQLMGLRFYARTGVPDEELAGMINDIFAA